MKINNIQLKNFRNHNNITIDFSNNINVILGNNGTGKTSIIESIYFTCFLKSYRTNADRDLITFNEDFSKIVINSENYFEIIINNKTKKCIYNSNVIKRQSDYVGLLKVSIFSPETMELILKSPSERRKYLDMFICLLDSSYINVLKEFYHVLKQRNEYIKQMSISSIPDKRYLDIVNEKYIELCCLIYKKREQTIKELNIHVKKYFSTFFDFSFELKYLFHSSLDMENIKDTFQQKLDNNYQRELALGVTVTGPTKDDIEFLVNDCNVKFFGSKGQQRIALIALKLAEVDLIKEKFDNYPILILDDVLSELDTKRQNTLFDILEEKEIQTIITATELDNSLDKDAYKIFTIE